MKVFNLVDSSYVPFCNLSMVLYKKLKYLTGAKTLGFHKVGSDISTDPFRRGRISLYSRYSGRLISIDVNPQPLYIFFIRNFFG